MENEIEIVHLVKTRLNFDASLETEIRKKIQAQISFYVLTFKR